MLLYFACIRSRLHGCDDFFFVLLVSDPDCMDMMMLLCFACIRSRLHGCDDIFFVACIRSRLHGYDDASLFCLYQIQIAWI